MTHLYADEDYLDYYQFEHDPFSDHRASFKFFSAKRQSVLVEMQHIARYSNLMLVVTGPQGSGKTILRQALAASAEDHVKNIVITASATADAAAMLQQVNIALGLQGSEIADVLTHIEDMLAAGHEVYVIVDNAEFLDESALLFLQRIAQGVNDACARVFVFSDSSICPLLEKVADNSDLHHVIALEPWDEQETIEYIEQRLIASGQNLDLFTKHQLKNVFEQSQGWPGRVNSGAKAVLIEQIDRQGAVVKKVAAPIPYKHLAILAVLIIALLLMWLMQSPDSERATEQASVPVPAAQPSQQVGDANGAQSQKIQRELSLELVPATVILPEKSESQTQVQPKTSAVVTTPVAPVSQPRVKVVQPAPVVKKPAPTVQPTRPAPAPAKPVVVQKPAPVPTPSTPVSSVAQNQWYTQQTSSRYTLQVLATSSEASARNFVQKSPAQYHYFRKQHQGQALYVVTSGSFVDRAAALVGVNSLPENLRKDKPWPRSMLSIQQELR